MPTPIEQLLSRTVHAGDGVTTVWNFSFSGGYLDKSHVKARINYPSGAEEHIVVTPEMLIGEFQLQLLDPPAALSELTIYRDTPKDLPLVDFLDGSGFNEIALDTQAKQSVFIAAEAVDTLNSADLAQATLASAIRAEAAAAAAELAKTLAEAAAVQAQASAVSADASEATAVASAASATTSANTATTKAAEAAASAAAALAAMATKAEKHNPVLTGNMSLNGSTGATSQVVTRQADGSVAWQTPQQAPVTSVAGRTGAVTLTRADVGLSSVDNTEDVDKPVSTLQQAALNLKANAANPVITGGITLNGGTGAVGQVITRQANGTSAWQTPLPDAVTSVAGRTGVVVLNKSDVSLSSVDNTTDLAKPISTATQAALNLKANAASPVFTGPASFNGGTGTAGQVLISGGAGPATWATPGAGTGVNSDVQTALNLKANVADPLFTGSMTLNGSTGTVGQVPVRQADGTIQWGVPSGGGVTSFRGPNGLARSGDVVLSADDFGGVFGNTRLTDFNVGTTYNGDDVTAFGVNALLYNYRPGNTAIGSKAMSNLAGSPAQGGNSTMYNTAVGAYALRGSQLRAAYNNAFGYESLYNLESGSWNCCFGNGTAYLLSFGSYNSAFGHQALNLTTTGASNVALGYQTLYLNTTGGSNTAVGYQALYSNTTISNCTGVGNGATVTAANQVQLGNASTTTYVYGTVQNRSDLRDKADVRNTVLGLSFIEKLRPVDYRWDMREDYRPPIPAPFSETAPPLVAAPSIWAAYEEAKAAHAAEMTTWIAASKLSAITRTGAKKRNRYHHGLIAQEVAAVIAETGVDFGGFQNHSLSGGEDVLSLGYDELIAPLIKAVQELALRVKQLENKP